MKVIAVSHENNVIRERFFKVAFGDSSGWIALATKTKSSFTEEYFRYPQELDKLLEWINRNVRGKDMYFCPQVLSAPKREKKNVKICPTLWADLDDVQIEKVNPAPSILVETSPGRYQALWLLDTPAEPVVAENASRKLAYSNKADTSGWDLTQLLRVPLTYNLKHTVSGDPPIVTLLDISEDSKYNIEQFKDLEDAPEFKRTEIPFPADKIYALDPEDVLKKYRHKLMPHVFIAYERPPESDWSSALWSLETSLLEAGMTPEETFVVAWSSAANKYKRDERSKQDLWREILKAKSVVDLKTPDEENEAITVGELLTDKEREVVSNLPDTFVEQYVKWATSRSDAAWQYHEAGAFIILSALVSEGLKIPTSFGALYPNLWFMLLGDTTLTRKTTAMEMALENLLTIYDDCVLATDGSIEGILTALGQRPKRASLFWRDEFSGLLDSMRKKDYYSGMVESLTKLYDGKYQKRVLRRETIEVRDPLFILFAGGIKSRITELLDVEYVISGFVPRFVYIVAEPDLNSFKPLGQGSAQLTAASTEILDQLAKLREWYSSDITVVVGDQGVQTKKVYDAILTDEALARYNQMERQLVEAGIKSDAPEIYTPTMDRLAKSGLKVAALIAASRQDPRASGNVKVELDDVLRAVKYVASWVPHSVYVVENAGKSVSEKQLERALRLIQGGKDNRSHLMRSMRLTSRDTDLILDTLEQRGHIVRQKYKKLEKLFPAV